MENSEDENIQALLSMGFSDVATIRKALKIGKNDLNEAVTYLTQEGPMNEYESFTDVEMHEVSSQNYSQEPPSYSSVFDSSSTNGNGDSHNMEEMQQDPENDLVFPYEYLVELEGRVYVEVWSIPYKHDESLAKLLRASTRLMTEGLAESDENCKRFMDKCMPECFDKLLMSNAVQRWAHDVQEGIHDMLLYFLDLIIETLDKAKQPPMVMLKILAKAFDPETDWHYKNRSRPWSQYMWESRLSGADKVYAKPPTTSSGLCSEQYGWMVNLINTFCEKGGLTKLQRLVETCDNLDAAQYAAVLRPFGGCAAYLNRKMVQDNISPIIEEAGTYVRELKEEDFKQKKLGSVSELLTIMKLIYRKLWSTDVASVDELRLSVTLRMIKSPHFNAKMNALNELTKLIEDKDMEKEKILDWLLANSVLTITLDSHMDQSQYCDKIRTLVDFIGDNMSMDELSHMWQMQNNQSLAVSENVQSILSAAAVKFNDSQLDQLFQLIHHSWLREDERRRRQLVSFIGGIGHNSKSTKTMEKVLDLLWDLSHLPKLPSHLVELAMREHHAILNDSSHVRDSLKKTFIVRCIDDIRKDTWVVPALKQMYDIANTCGKSYSSKSDRGVLFDMNRQHDLLKLIVTSLSRCHKVAVHSAAEQRTDLSAELLVDGKYKHSDFMSWHLEFLRFLLKDANIYLPWNRAREVWDTLVSNRDSCQEDNVACYEWFEQSLDDLENDTIKLMFRERLLKLDPSSICRAAYYCLMKFMEATNVNEQKIKKSSTNLYVEKLDLYGLDFLWRVCLECPCEEVAELSINTLVKLSFLAVSMSLRKDEKALHLRFIGECYKRLNQSTLASESSVLAHAVNKVTKTLAANILPDVTVHASPSGATRLLMTERILLLAERYIIQVEKAHYDARSLLPHGASFWGSPIRINVTCESPRLQFSILTHSNDTVANVRSQVASQFCTASEQVTLCLPDRTLYQAHDRRLLRMIPFDSHQEVVAKTTVSPATVNTEEDMNSSQTKTSYLIEKEQKLPSVVMANKGHDTFEVLYQLTELNEQRVTQRARSLILLIPSDPDVVKMLKKITIVDTIDQDADLRNGAVDSPISVNMSPERPTGLMIDRSPKRQRTPRSPLDSLFRLSSPGMNLFRLRYNLEVLSSLLIPITDQQLADNDSGEYVKSFLNHGGLQMILNILQNEVVSEMVENQADADTRRGCYTIALTIARFLLCGQASAADDSFPHNRFGSSRLSMSLEAGATPTSPTKRDFTMDYVSSSVEYSATPTKKNRRNSLSQSPVILPQEVPKVARSAVQLMDEQDFMLLISTLVRIAWFASASKLDQVTVAKTSDHEGTSFSRSRKWSKESSSSTVSISNISPYVGRSTSTGSISSSGSMESDSHQAFPSRRDEPPPNPDAVVAQQALELLVTCLQLRNSHVDRFFGLPSVGEFIVDLLTQPNNLDIRQRAVEQFHALSNIEPPSVVNGARHQLLKIILKARLPLWGQNTFLRSQGQKIVRNCLQYFELRSKLIKDVVDKKMQDKCGVNPKTMLEDEISWLENFEVPASAEYAESSSARVLDNTLLTGHLRLIKMLISCPKINKKKIGSKLITKLLNEFLFPASKLILDSSTQARGKRIFSDFQPKCSAADSRSAAFGVLIELCLECTENLQQVSSQLLSMHHYPDLSRSKEFDFQPLVDSRPEHGLVGLKNAGATCYMNSILQQLFMIKNLAPLCAEVGDADDESTILYQLQRIFGHLSESRLQYYIPETFWKTFKLWGQPINVREQQDAFMFFTDLSDQIDEYLKSKNQVPLFKKTLQGLFSDQKICEGCPHKYEREEPYFALNLAVKCGDLHDSLDQFVAGEKLEGDNAYFCEKCNTKRTALKRTCIKTLPPILIMQLKRFVYDWETSRSLKFDHFFQFPLTLDMTPYTEEGLARQEQGRSRHNTSESNMYELVGVVVHSGQASAGHYYSFIKDRRGTQMSNPWRGKWFKFNDTTVEEFEMNDVNWAEECFGGTFKSKVCERGTTYHEDRLRYWNAYLLFYERMENCDMGRKRSTEGRSRVTFLNRPEFDPMIPSPLTSSPDTSPPNSPRQANDKRLSQLSSLIRKGEQRRMFMSRMPASISHLVREENLQFMRNRDIYCQQYFDFVKELASVNLNCVDSYPAIAVTSLQLSTQFLFNTYFRTRRSLTANVNEWCDLVLGIITKSNPACVWFVSQLHSATGFPNVQAFLLECPNEEIRKTFETILLKTLEGFVTRKTGKEPAGFDPLLSRLVALLDREVAEHVKQSQQFFSLLAHFTALSARACEVTLRHDVFVRLLRFLLGETATKPLLKDQHPPTTNGGSGDAPCSSTIQSDAVAGMQENETIASRRWSSIQSREFGFLHCAITNLVLHSDMSSVWTVKKKSNLPSYKPQTISVTQRIPLPEPIKHGVFGVVGSRLLHEFLLAVREVSSSCPAVSDFICHCAFNNEEYSEKAIHLILSEVCSVPGNELASLLTLLSDLLSIEDAFHTTRLSQAVEKSPNALLTIIKHTIKSDEPKCYQCIKMLVQLSNRSASNQEYLVSISGQWSFAVSWLKGKMKNEFSFSSTTKFSDLHSNETSKYFQRTMSAQNTLEEVTRLLGNKEVSNLPETDEVELDTL